MKTSLLQITIVPAKHDILSVFLDFDHTWSYSLNLCLYQQIF